MWAENDKKVIQAKTRDGKERKGLKGQMHRKDPSYMYDLRFHS